MYLFELFNAIPSLILSKSIPHLKKVKVKNLILKDQVSAYSSLLRRDDRITVDNREVRSERRRVIFLGSEAIDIPLSADWGIIAKLARLPPPALSLTTTFDFILKESDEVVSCSNFL